MSGCSLAIPDRGSASIAGFGTGNPGKIGSQPELRDILFAVLGSVDHNQRTDCTNCVQNTPDLR